MIVIQPFKVTDSYLRSSNISEVDYPEWSSVETYSLGDRVIRLNDHKIYESLQDSNINKLPSTEGTFWVVVGATNRWRMFDDIISDPSTNEATIDVSIQALGFVDTIAALNISATSIRIIITNSYTGVVEYDVETVLTRQGEVRDWYAYFHVLPKFSDSYVITGLPLIPDPIIRVIFSGVTVKVGELVLGLGIDLGNTQYGLSLGIVDYSLKSRDQFGNYFITERAFSKRANITLELYNIDLDFIYKTLSDLRAKPTLYYSTTDYSSTWIYGIYKDFSITIQYPTVSICNLELEGLT